MTKIILKLNQIKYYSHFIINKTENCFIINFSIISVATFEGSKNVITLISIINIIIIITYIN